MSHLEVDGASLYYETVGEGPTLLCISGANGSVEPWRGFAQELKDKFTVVMYDRRGFSRSYLNGTQDYEHRIETDADDAAALIKHISSEPGYIIANSSGAVVSLVLLTRHPDVINKLNLYEPPAHQLLEDRAERTAEQQDMYDTYRRGGMAPALEKFGKSVKIGREGPALMAAFDARNGPVLFANAMYWFEREFLPYPGRKFDIEEIGKYKDKLILVAGEHTEKDVAHYRPLVVLSEKFGLEITIFPGGHLGFASHPKEFGQRLVEVNKV